MNTRISSLERDVRLIARAAMDDRITFLSASIAFYAVLSIFPILLIAVAVGSWIGGEQFAGIFLGFASDILTPEAELLLEEALLAEGGRGGASVIGAVFLVWAALKVFRGLDIAFSQVYGQQAPAPTFLRSVLHAAVVFVAVGAAFLTIFFVHVLIRFAELSPLISSFSPLISFGVLAVLFYPMYFVFPGVRQPPLEVLPGTLFAAAGWTLLAELFGFYAANAGTFALLGIIGGVILLLMWFYFGSVVLLMGATINAVIAGRYREPDDLNAGEIPFEVGEERTIGIDRDDPVERDE